MFVSWTYWTVQSDDQQNWALSNYKEHVSHIRLSSIENISNPLENMNVKFIHDNVYVFNELTKKIKSVVN